MVKSCGWPHLLMSYSVSVAANERYINSRFDVLMVELFIKRDNYLNHTELMRKHRKFKPKHVF